MPEYRIRPTLLFLHHLDINCKHSAKKFDSEVDIDVRGTDDEDWGGRGHLHSEDGSILFCGRLII